MRTLRCPSTALLASATLAYLTFAVGARAEPVPTGRLPDTAIPLSCGQAALEVAVQDSGAPAFDAVLGELAHEGDAPLAAWAAAHPVR